jgi:transposase
VDRDQAYLMPPSLAEWLPPEHPVFFVIDVVEDMRDELAVFHRRRVLGGTGRAGYDPLMLVTVLVYAMWQGVRSSRQIEARCHTDVAFRIACAQDPPDHSTIARFRQHNAERMTALFTAVLLVCAEAGMGRFGKVSIDGTKIKANASTAANVTLQHMRKLAEAEVAAGLAADADDEVDVDASPPAALRDRSGRAQRLERVRRELEADQAERDKAEQAAKDRAVKYEAKAAAGANGRGHPPAGADRVAVSRARYERLVAAQQAKIDEYEAAKAKPWQERGCRITPPTPVESNGRVRAARENLQRAERAATARSAPASTTRAAADTGKQRPSEPAKPAQPARRNLSDPDSRLMPVHGGGFVQGYNLQAAVSDDHLIVGLKVADTPADVTQAQDMIRVVQDAAQSVAAGTGRTDTTIGLLLFDAGYDSNANLTAPGPDRLIANAKRHQHERNARSNPTAGPPPPEATPRQAMDHRLRTPEGIAAYRRRSATVETVFGHLKGVLGIRHLLTRGLNNVTGEVTLAAAVFNLRRLYTYIGTQAAS